MTSSSLSHVDLTGPVPDVFVPRAYNAAVDLLERNLLGGRADKPAIIDAAGPHTYAELSARSNRVVNLLRELGLRMEERVLLLLLDTVDFPALFLGAIKAGVVPVPVNTLLTGADWQYFVRDSRARALFVSDALVSRLEPALRDAPFLEHVVVVDRAGGTASHGYPTLARLLDGVAEDAVAAPTCRDDVAFWLYSSGSTGAPKAALHVHSSLAQTAALYAQSILGLTEHDLIFSVPKLFFAYGLGNALTFPFYVGATALLLAERPTPAAVSKLFRHYEPSIFAAVPSFFAALLAAPEFRDALSRPPRLSVSAGEALPRHLGEAWRSRVGSDVLDGIGSTELLHIFISNRPGEVHYGTSGRPVPGYEVKLIDEAGHEADTGTLWVKAPTACTGYWLQRERSSAIFHGPWACTGDFYARDPDGFYAFLGRTDDMLKVNGNWLSPSEVEAALSTHPAVLEAAVVGVADLDELVKPKAFVVLRQGNRASTALAQELKDHVKQRLAPFKYPRSVEFVDTLPRTATGKVRRCELRQGTEDLGENVERGARVREVLRALAGNRAQGLLRTHESAPTPAALLDFDEHHDELVVRLSTAAADAGPGRLELRSYVATYSLPVEPHAAAGGELRLALPTSLVRCRRRSGQRAPAHELCLRVPEASGVAGPLELSVKDIGHRGLGVWLHAPSSAWEPGTRLRALELSGKDRRVRFDAEVRSLIHAQGRVGCGLCVDVTSLSDRLAWNALVDPLLHPSTRSRPEQRAALWQLYVASGYLELSGHAPTQFERRRAEFEHASEILRQNPELGCQIVFPGSHPGELLASLSLLKTHAHAWFGFHMAKRPGRVFGRTSGREILREIHLHAYEHAAIDPDLRWLLGYVQPKTRFTRLVHQDFAARHADADKAAVIPFRALRRDVRAGERRLPAARGNARARSAEASERESVLSHIARHFPAAYVEALDLVPERFEFASLSAAWATAGLERERGLIVVERGRRLVAAAVLETATAGLHLYGLLDSARLYALSGEWKPELDLLMDACSEWFERHGRREFVVLLDGSEGEALPDLRDLGPASLTVVHASLLGDLLEHVYEVTAPAPERGCAQVSA
jgi:benzoate-CoA ligase family protein